MASLFSSAFRTLARLLVLPLALLVGLAGPAQAAQWTADQLTVPATADGSTVSFSEQEIKSGRKIFNSSCGECHAGGITKTNQNVGLDPETLAAAAPLASLALAAVDAGLPI